MKTLLIITRTLNVSNGLGRYSLGLINELKKDYKLTALITQGEAIEGIEIIKIPDLFHPRNPLDIIKYFLLCLKYSKKVDFIHFFTDLPYYLIFSPLVWFKLKPYFVTIHGTYGVVPFKNKWKRFFLKRIYRRARKVFCVSNFTQKQVLKRISLNNTTVIFNGIDFEKFTNLKIGSVRKMKNLILSVGAIKVRKGYHISVPAAVEAKNKFLI